MTHDERKRIFIACTPEDYALIQAKIRASGLTQQDFFMKAALEEPVVLPTGYYEFERIAVELKKLANAMSNVPDSESVGICKEYLNLLLQNCS